VNTFSDIPLRIGRIILVTLLFIALFISFGLQAYSAAQPSPTCIASKIDATNGIVESLCPGSSGVVPSQFIAKMYTEALGRAPDQIGWFLYTD
jgi:hypothetical protein